MNGSAVFSRPMSPFEWLYQANPARASMVVQIFVEGDGELDTGLLREAVAAAGEACPGSRLRRNGRRWVDSGQAPAVRVVAGDGRDPVRCWANDPALLHPLRGDNGRATTEVIHITGERPAVVFRAHHSVMDGHGTLLWATEVFRALRGDEPIPHRSTEVEIDVADRVQAGPSTLRTQALKPVLQSAAPYARRPRYSLHRSVDGNHPALAAKVAAFLAGHFQMPETVFLIPVDLRRHDPALRGTANLSLGLTVAVTGPESWPEIHQRILAALASNAEAAYPEMVARSLRMPLGVLRPMARMADKASARRGQPWHFLLSHLGRVERPDFTTGSFRATAVYAAQQRGLQALPTITMCESAGRTEIVLSADDEPERGAWILDGIVAELAPTASRLSGRRDNAPAGATLVGRFAEQVARTPGGVALSHGTTDMTYAELAGRAATIAAELVRRGVGRGDVVGLLAGRTFDAITGIFGILGSGAAFLPLDDKHPDARLADVLADAGARVCLTDPGNAGRDVRPDGCAMLELSTVGATGGPPAADPVEPDDLACVVYTSGSTGKPKGVEVSHGNLANYAHWAIRTHGVDERSRFALFSSIAYLLPYTAILLPLFAGGSIILVPEEPNHVTLGRLLGGELGVNSLKITPSHMELISRLGLTADGIRLVVFGGERLSGDVAARAQASFGPDCRIFNGNGITEMSGACAMHPFDSATESEVASVPIGRPVDNNEIILLDPNGAPVRAGEVGEMHTSGAQLVRGYRNRAEATAERFVRLADGTRVYRTGDLARVLPSGELEHVGRADEQVKVLGYRVEPAEVTAVLRGHPAVREALVLPRSAPGRRDKTLCAYVSTTAPATPAELTAHVAQRLPRQMVPSIVLVLDELPRNANGKIDKPALPDPWLAAGADGAEPPVLDEGAVAVARIWSDVLGTPVDEVLRHGDFNVLGGDSISFLAMVSAVTRTLAAGADAEKATAGLAGLIASPTLEAVTTFVRNLGAV
jgi:amino acid adenylation domain-containing protein